jgi:hypothetical protein
MKRVIFLSLVIALIIGSCTQEKKSPIEGTWKMVYAQSRSMEETFPAQVQAEQIKTWSKEHFTFVGHYKLPTDTIFRDNYGWGTYTLNGNKFEEHIMLHASKSNIGQTIRMLMDVRNDTLIQRWPADENWNLPEKFSMEKYVRLK